MFILPIIKSFQKADDFEMDILHVFMVDGGKKIWETDEKNPTKNFVIKEYLEPNGFRGKYVKEDCLICLIYPKQTNIHSYYIWPEKADELWRPFTLVRNAGWEEEADRFHLDNFGTIGKIWSLVKAASV